MRIFLLALIGAVYLIIGTGAYASESPIFEKAEDWVEIVDIQDVIAKSGDSQAVFVLVDRQTQLVPGMVSNYADFAFRIGSAKTMTEMVPVLSPSWHPDQGDLIIHRFEIVRGSQVIDLTSNDDLFQVIRREKNLERQMINGNLTALSQVEDVQLNDIVRISFTITKRNDALGDRVQTIGQFLDEAIKVDFLRQTVRWPKEMQVKWRTTKSEATPVATSQNGWETLSFDYRARELGVEIPKNAPMRFKDRNFFEAGSFASWQDVSKVNARLYTADDGVVEGGDLDQEIQAIARQTSDEKERMALALQLVQDKVRYLFNGLGFGNYAPQSPEETWRLRYGDCKAKTYLLLAVLRRLDIDAVPMLVSTSQRDAVAERLPSFLAFNHIIVKAQSGGVTYWLDGTQNGTVAADMGDAPAHRYGLPSIAGGADLEDIPIRRPGRPFQAVRVIYDLTTGTDLPALFDLKAELRDTDAQGLKVATEQFSREKLKEFREEVALRYVFSGLVSESQFTYDETLETGFITARGVSYLDWATKAGQREHNIWSQASSFEVQKTRNDAELRDLPVRLNYPEYFKYQTTYILPERYKGAVISGKAKVDDDFAGSRFERTVERKGDRIISNEAYYTDRWELPADEFELERRKLAFLKRGKVKITLPDDAPKPWEELPELEASDQLQAHIEAFDKRVANAEEGDTDRLQSRAYFNELRGDYESAISDLKIVADTETDPEIYEWLGSLQKGNDPDAAKANYSKAIAIKPAYFDAVLALIRLHVIAGDFDEANAVLERAKTNGMRDTSVASVQIELLQAEGKFDEALQVMDALVDEDPDDATYLADRCLLRAMEGKGLDIALDDCTNMIELAKRSTYHHFIRGLVYYRQGEYEAAIADLDKAIRTEADSGYAYFLRAAANRKLGQIEAAKSDEAASNYYYKFDGMYWSRFIK